MLELLRRHGVQDQPGRIHELRLDLRPPSATTLAVGNRDSFGEFCDPIKNHLPTVLSCGGPQCVRY
jgi:hypothetical protein